MKIRCGSHQQNRSIVRPGLSLMATKVALTAEEFRENSQRSIALFNTEKLSTDSTHVLKSAYCILCISAVAICTERVEAKAQSPFRFRLCRRCNLHGACGGKGKYGWETIRATYVAICTERVEAKAIRESIDSEMPGCNLHGACGGKVLCGFGCSGFFCVCCNLHGACGGKGRRFRLVLYGLAVAICTERVEAKPDSLEDKPFPPMLQSARSVWRQRALQAEQARALKLQSARSVWRQSLYSFWVKFRSIVAICTERVEAKALAPLVFRNFGVAICTERVEAKTMALCCVSRHNGCNLHGACGGKEPQQP